MIRKIALSLTAVSALAAAVPAAAAPGGINAQQARIEQRIEAGVRQQQLTRREASTLRIQAREIARLEARYRVNGLSAWERNDLERRLVRLDARVGAERNDRVYAGGYGGHRR